MPIQLPNNLMAGVSGVRGIVGDPLTPELVSALAAAYGTFLQNDGAQAGAAVFLGRDSRTSGPMFVRAAAAGLLSVGMDVVELGVVPTPTLLLATREGEGAGAVGVTASHNPAEWNALKLAGGDGIFLDRERMGRFLSFLETSDPVRASWDRLGSWREDSGAIERHLERILGLRLLNVEGIRRRRMRVALDCVRGAGGRIMPTLLERLGCEVVGMGLETDGRFPRDPEPTAANLTELGELVRREGAELGLAVDPDVDRLSLVDGRGFPVGEDLTLALAAATVLARTPGPVVTNLSTSRVLDDVAEKWGAKVHRAPVGEVNVARRIQELGAVVGGEGNGGVILPALQLTRDAPLAAALILQHLVDLDEGLEGAISRWPEYRIVKEKVPVPDGGLEALYDDLREGLGPEEVDTQDGLRLDWPGEGRWLHVRPSGTEPVVRFIAEARDETAARELVDTARRMLESGARRDG